jgi:hypothetical protein
MNDGAKAAQASELFFALVGLYLLATAFSANDQDVLLGRTVVISRIGATLRVSFSFAIAPFVFRVRLPSTSIPSCATICSPRTADAAASLRVRLVTFEASKEADFDGVFAQIGASGAGGLLAVGNPFLFQHHRRIVAFANRSQLPAVYEWAEIARNGGLMAYGDSIAALYRRAGDYVGRVLKGAKPADLPIDFPPEIRLTINLKTASEIGFSFPPGFRDRADEVIE